MDLKHVLERAPGVNRRFIYYLESQGMISPRRLQKSRIARRDYGEDDVHVIREVWRYYSQGFSLQAAFKLAVEDERTLAYVTFQAAPASRTEILERLKDIPEILEASVVYADTADFLVKLAAPREADFYNALLPVFAHVGVTGVPDLYRASGHYVNENAPLEQEAETAMMAYVLMKVPGKNIGDALEAIQGLDGIVEASAVYGESDIVVRVSVPSQGKLDSLIMDELHSVPGVESTRTYIVIGGMHWERPPGGS